MMVSQQEPIRSEADYEKARALGRVWGVSGQAVLFAPPFRNKENNHKEGQKQQRVDAVLMHGGGRARQHGAPSKQSYSAQSQCWEMLPAYLDCPGRRGKTAKCRFRGSLEAANGLEPPNGGFADLRYENSGSPVGGPPRPPALATSARPTGEHIFHARGVTDPGIAVNPLTVVGTILNGDWVSSIQLGVSYFVLGRRRVGVATDGRFVGGFGPRCSEHKVVPGVAFLKQPPSPLFQY